MIVVLAGIVEETGILAERALDHVLQRLAFPLAALEQVVAIIDVGEVVLVVVVFQRLARHVGSKRVVSVWKVRECKGHWVLLDDRKTRRSRSISRRFCGGDQAPVGLSSTARGEGEPHPLGRGRNAHAGDCCRASLWLTAWARP